MKLVIKTLKQVTYNVEISSENSTILELKKEIEKLHGFDSSTLKLLFNGKLLEDSKILKDYDIQNECTIVMMNSKVKPKNVKNSSEIDSTQKKVEDKRDEKKEGGIREKKIDNKKQSEIEKPKINEAQFTQQLNSLVDMGFERPKAESAIKAARGQIDLAIEYLYNGIPEGIKDIELNQGQGGNFGNIGQENDEDEEDPVKKVASIAKVLCQNNAASLPRLLQSIEQNDPDLMNLIKEKQEEFKTYLEQPVSDNDHRIFQRFQQEMGLGGLGGINPGHVSRQRHINLNLTPEDREVINRLKDLGNFSEADVVQAYIACDKNEELTANYLFEQKMKDFNNGNNQ